MKSFGKSIKIFLIEGDPNGRMTCELSNWTGKAYKIPRNRVKECVDRGELKTTGVYFLFGKSDDNTSSGRVYIGEAENVLKRLNEHLKKDFWNTAILFVSKDENLNKAHIKYLENRIYEIALSAGRYVIENSNIPTKSKISESDEAEMEEFLANIAVLTNALGFKVLENIRETTLETEEKGGDLFIIKAARGADAVGSTTSEGFVVLKGSKATRSITNTCPKTVVKLREKLLEEKVLIDHGEYYEFLKDYSFSSPSTAAAVVMGRSANGLIEWKMENGKILKAFENENL